MREDTIKQNAISAKAGDIYHYYVAIQLMFQHNSWDKCIIEQYGDIVLLNNNGNQIINIEVKHHFEKTELKVYEEEFQKTLSNWFDIKDLFNYDTQLILMTASTVSRDNPLQCWNLFNADKKYKTLLENQKKQDDSYYSSVKKYFLPINKDIDELKELLRKIELQHTLPTIASIRDEIKKENYFRLFNDEGKKDKVIDELYGLIGRGLENKAKWEITKSQFDQKLRESTSLIQDKILRTDNSIDKSKVNANIKNYEEKQFIQKLKNIEFEEDVFGLAIDDYAKSIIEITDRTHLSSSLEFDERLEKYDQSLVRLVNSTKTKYNYHKKLTDIEKSQESYWEIMNAPKIPFMPEEFDDQTTYFQKGYLHILADDEEKSKQICWSLKPEDILK